MNATLACHALSALLVCGLAGASAHGADAVTSGSETQREIETNQTQESAGATDSAKRDVANRHSPIKGDGATDRRSNAGEPAARSGQQLASLHNRSKALLAHRSGTPAASSHTDVSRRARASAIGHLGSRSNADPPTYRSATATEAVRALRGNAASGAASHQLLQALLLTNRSKLSRKAQAGNGVIGGACAPGRSMIGGPASSRTVPAASIDGTSLRRRL